MKKVDERKIRPITLTEVMLKENEEKHFERIRKYLAIGYYYGGSSNTFGMRIPSCIEAGYGKDYAKNKSGTILEIDSLTVKDSPFWRKLEGLLPKAIMMLENWLNDHEKSTETVDIRELNKIIRLIGDSVGKFIKREERVTHHIDEKRAVIIYGTPQEHAKAIKEKIAVLSSQLVEIDGQDKKSG